jgi:RNA polymerase sigma-70 factor (ECF subfamily)
MSRLEFDADFERRFAQISEKHGLAVDRARFVEWAASHPHASRALGAEDDEPLTELVLAKALGEGSTQASQVFEKRYLAPLAPRLARLRLSDTELDEVKQRTREKLLVRSPGARLRIEDYAGEGRLAGLIQVTATREALSLYRKKRRETSLDEGALAPAFDFDPGIEMLKGRARDAFREAFATAVAGLEPRERNLLRLHLLGGVTLEKLAELHAVHRATIVRWLAAAREQVARDTESAVGRALELQGTELESVMNAIRSRMDLSVERLFRSQAAETRGVSGS